MKAEEFPVVLFSSQDGDVRVNAVLRDRTLWLTQKSMAGLFGVKSQAITKHLKNIYATGELQIAPTCSKMEQVQSEGGRNLAREIGNCNIYRFTLQRCSVRGQGRKNNAHKSQKSCRTASPSKKTPARKVDLAGKRKYSIKKALSVHLDYMQRKTRPQKKSKIVLACGDER